MRIKQDLSIALVLAVLGCGLASPAISCNERQDALGRLEAAIDDSELTAEESEKVRSLVALATALQTAGDEDGAARAMADALSILKA